MTDLELLELAAKAAGISGRYSRHDYWYPLTDDGDSRRLQVQLGIDVTVSGKHAAVASYINGPNFQVHANGDLCAATRRAVLLAAAEIGKGRP